MDAAAREIENLRHQNEQLKVLLFRSGALSDNKIDTSELDAKTVGFITLSEVIIGEDSFKFVLNVKG